MFGVGRLLAIYRTWAFGVFFLPSLASLRPPRRHLRAPRRVIVFAWVGDAFVEGHGDVAPKRRLNFHRDLRRNERSRSVDVVLKFDAVLRDFAQLGQGK